MRTTVTAIQVATENGDDAQVTTKTEQTTQSVDDDQVADQSNDDATTESRIPTTTKSGITESSVMTTTQSGITKSGITESSVMTTTQSSSVQKVPKFLPKRVRRSIWTNYLIDWLTVWGARIHFLMRDFGQSGEPHL